MNAEPITTTSITLVDSSGKTRMLLDGGGDTGCASINLFSPTGQAVHIAAQPGGHVTLALDCKQVKLGITLGPCGLTIRDSKGLLGITVGDPFEDGTLSVTVFRDGQPIYSIPPDESAPPQVA